MKIIGSIILLFVWNYLSAGAHTNTEVLISASIISNDSIPDTISIVNNHYSYKGSYVTYKNLAPIMKDNPDASQLLKNAKSSKVAAGVFSFAGGFLLGYAVANSLIKKKVNYGLGGVGLSLIIVSIPFESGARKSTSDAVRVFNAGQKSK